jgi:hypothetical protein
MTGSYEFGEDMANPLPAGVVARQLPSGLLIIS